MNTLTRTRSLLLFNLLALAAMLASLAATPTVPPQLSLSGATDAALHASAAPTPFDGLRALQARAQGPLMASWDARTGIPQFLTAHDAAQRLPYTPSPAERGNAIAIARGFLDENRALFKLTSAADELRLLRVEPDFQRGFAHVRLDQMYRGVPVFGRQLAVHLDASERIVAVNGQFEPALDLDLAPTLAQADAEAIALREVRDNFVDLEQAETFEASALTAKTRLIVYADAGAPKLTWEVHVLGARPLATWLVFVNAKRPQVVHALTSSHTLKRRQTFTARNSTNIPGRLLAEEGQLPRDPVAQAAHEGAGKVYDFFFSSFNRDGLDGHGSPLISTVNYGSDPSDSENAAWIGEAAQMVYGDGGRIFKPLAYGLDVVGHEFTHGVVESTANLVYEGQSGALNESYADVFGVLIAGSNWEVGSSVVKSPPFPTRVLRSLSDPGIGGAYNARDPLNSAGQPSNMREYANLPVRRQTDNGGVHVNSGVPNKAAFLVANALGKDKAAQIYYRALSQYLTPRAKFIDAANASVRAAQDLYGQAEADAVRNAFAQVGIAAGGADTTPAAPTQTQTQRPPAQPAQEEQLPSGCTNVALNGNFEGDGNWKQIMKGGSGIISDEVPHTGKRSAWLGGDDKESTQAIYQDIAIPANATQVALKYWQLVHQETSGLLGMFAGKAKFATLIADTRGNILGAVDEVTSDAATDRWEQKQFDLSQLAGKTIRLGFSSENPRGNISSGFIDDVVLSACTSGQGPAAPTTRSQDLVFVNGTVQDADTGRGVSGAQVFYLKPGVGAQQAAEDDRITTDEVQTQAVSDGNGFYQTEQPIQRGQAYGVIIIARGYRPIVADNGANVPASATNPSTLNATLRRNR